MNVYLYFNDRFVTIKLSKKELLIKIIAWKSIKFKEYKSIQY